MMVAGITLPDFVMKKILTILMSLTAALCGWVQGAPEATPTEVAPQRLLIVYYSWGGNTRTAAQTVQQATGGKLVEIAPKVPYPASYRACVDQAKKEINEGFLPEISLSEPVDWSRYDVVLVGSPNWWSTLAPPVSSFLTHYPLKGKKVAVFVTHGGGGMARCQREAKRLAPGAVFLRGAAFPGSSVADDADTIQRWVNHILTVKK